MKPKSWRDGIPFVQAVYKRPMGAAGCCNHVRIDDGNLSHHFFSENNHKELMDKGHADCIALYEILARMSATQRTRLYKEWGCAT